MIYTHAAAALVSAGLAFGGAWQVQNWRYESKDAVRIENERELQRLQQRTATVASAGHEQDKVQIQTKFVTITEEVDRVVEKIEYRDRMCFDDDGLRAHAGAVRLTGNAGQPGYALPAAAVSE